MPRPQTARAFPRPPSKTPSMPALPALAFLESHGLPVWPAPPSSPGTTTPKTTGFPLRAHRPRLRICTTFPPDPRGQSARRACRTAPFRLGQARTDAVPGPATDALPGRARMGATERRAYGTAREYSHGYSQSQPDARAHAAEPLAARPPSASRQQAAASGARALGRPRARHRHTLSDRLKALVGLRTRQPARVVSTSDTVPRRDRPVGPGLVVRIDAVEGDMPPRPPRPHRSPGTASFLIHREPGERRSKLSAESGLSAPWTPGSRSTRDALPTTSGPIACTMPRTAPLFRTSLHVPLGLISHFSSETSDGGASAPASGQLPSAEYTPQSGALFGGRTTPCTSQPLSSRWSGRTDATGYDAGDEDSDASGAVNATRDGDVVRRVVSGSSLPWQLAAAIREPWEDSILCVYEAGADSLRDTGESA